MAKRKPKEPKLKKASGNVRYINKPKRQPNVAQVITADYITSSLERGLEAFIVAGAEILQRDYDFTPEQASEWADKAVELGSKYMKGARVPQGE